MPNPKPKRETGPGMAEASSQNEEGGGPIRVGIIEDNAPMRGHLQRLFNCAPGFQCVGTYETGEKALERLPEDKPEVVLVDINLPGMDGVECLRRLKTTMPATVFVIHTVYENTERIFQAVQAGASGYLLKRTDPAGLLKAVREARHGGAPLTSLIARKILDTFREERNQPGSVGTEESVPALSAREQQVLERLAKGFVLKEIADQIGVSFATIRTYKERIYQKLHVRSRSELLAHYLQGKRPS